MEYPETRGKIVVVAHEDYRLTKECGESNASAEV
jgi:hypothetical protein